MTELLDQTWKAYESARDRGHTSFISKANKCEKFFRGEHWDSIDKSKLGDRPALTVNMVLATLATAFGQTLENYSEVSFLAKDGRYTESAKALQLVMKHIYQENSYKWKELDMAMDGFISGRGFLDVRMDFNENQRGDISIEHLDPRDVLIDAEAKSYTPQGWKEVFITRWFTLDEIKVLYGNAKASKLEGRTISSFSSITDRLTGDDLPGVIGGADAQRPLWVSGSSYGDTIPRRYRVVERQWKKLDTELHFLDEETGESRIIPSNWGEERIQKVLETSLENNVFLRVINRRVTRVRMTVVAADVVLFDDWSPYETFTVVPYFPYFRWGKTMGIVENLIGLQEGLNKVFSQTLHIINTTANSGWKVKAGALTNMTIEELEDHGADTGLVVEVANVDDLQKITANPIPQGLDRIANQLGEWVKYVSGISDSMRGFDRSDVAAKAIVAKQQAGAVSLAVPFESLNRTRTYLAEVILKMVQRFYTEPRVLRINPTNPEGRDETVEINTPTGQGILNDITLGEYGVRINMVPPSDRHEESQYRRAIEMKQAGIPIPDWAVIEVSGLPNKEEIIEDTKRSQEAAAPAQELEMQKLQAEVQAKQAEAANKAAQADVLKARVQEILTTIQGLDPKSAQSKAIVELQTALQQEKMVRDDEFRYRKLALDTLNKSSNKGNTDGRSTTTDTTSGGADPKLGGATGAAAGAAATATTAAGADSGGNERTSGGPRGG